MNIKNWVRSKIFHGILAFFLWGGWALYANWAHGIRSSMTSAIAQGVLSFGITNFMAISMEFLLKFSKKPMVQFFYAVFGTCTVQLSMLVGVHIIVNTPELLSTVFPAAVVAFSYCVFYTLGLIRVQNSVSHKY